MRLRQTRALPLCLVWLALFLALVRRPPLRLVEVAGTSMFPTLAPGDRLIAVRRLGRLAPGDLVLAPDPRLSSRVLVKRVARIENHNVFLEGDEALTSTDSRVFGAVPASSVIERVIYRYYPPARAGRLRRVRPGEASPVSGMKRRVG